LSVALLLLSLPKLFASKDFGTKLEEGAGRGGPGRALDSTTGFETSNGRGGGARGGIALLWLTWLGGPVDEGEEDLFEASEGEDFKKLGGGLGDTG